MLLVGLKPNNIATRHERILLQWPTEKEWIIAGEETWC